MKTSNIRFTQLQKFFQEMGFSQAGEKEGWRFEHTSSNTVFVFRPYRPKDRVFEHDLFLVLSQLNGRGLMAEDAFNDSLTRTPA
jgi:hypothetical protein